MLRGLAAVLVVLHHQAQAATDFVPDFPALRALNDGAFGVDLFFPISGFVMSLTASSVLRQPPSRAAWQHFASRRYLRVAPLYYLFTCLKLSLYVVFPAAMLMYHFKLWNAAAAFFFVPTYNAHGSPEPPLPVGWTLNYEMFFYAIVTTAIAWRARLLPFCAAVIVPLALVGLVVPHRWGGFTYLADPIVLEFLAGMVLAAVWQRLERIPSWLAGVLLPVSLAFALYSPWSTTGLEFTPYRVLVWGIPGVLILAAALALERQLPFARWHALLLLGDASYMLYLSHTFVIPAIHLLALRLHVRGAWGLLVFLVAGQAISLGVAVQLHRRLELPMLKRLLDMRLPWSARAASI